MAHNILKSFVVIMFLSVVVLSPILPTSDAARFTADVLVGGPICPTCVCCTPPPPGLCCKCCSSPIVLSSLETTNGSPDMFFIRHPLIMSVIALLRPSEDGGI